MIVSLGNIFGKSIPRKNDEFNYPSKPDKLWEMCETGVKWNKLTGGNWNEGFTYLDYINEKITFREYKSVQKWFALNCHDGW